MGKRTVSIKEVIELNHILEEKGLSFKIHLHDACGAQSFSMETLSEDVAKEDCEKCKQEITTYFEGKGTLITFTQNGCDFFVM